MHHKNTFCLGIFCVNSTKLFEYGGKWANDRHLYAYWCKILPMGFAGSDVGDVDTSSGMVIAYIERTMVFGKSPCARWGVNRIEIYRLPLANT